MKTTFKPYKGTTQMQIEAETDQERALLTSVFGAPYPGKQGRSVARGRKLRLRYESQGSEIKKMWVEQVKYITPKFITKKVRGLETIISRQVIANEDQSDSFACGKSYFVWAKIVAEHKTYRDWAIIELNGCCRIWHVRAEFDFYLGDFWIWHQMNEEYSEVEHYKAHHLEVSRLLHAYKYKNASEEMKKLNRELRVYHAHTEEEFLLAMAELDRATKKA